MTSRARMSVAMRLGEPDRVPVMAQLALGHYFLNAGLDALDVWHSTEAFVEALVRLQQRYRFDGILVNLPGRDPAWHSRIERVDLRGQAQVVTWRNGWRTVAPPDDNPHVFRPDGTPLPPDIPRGRSRGALLRRAARLLGLTYPQSWELDGAPAEPGERFFPPWHLDTVRGIVARTGHAVSVHGEIFSPFSQFLELLDYTQCLHPRIRRFISGSPAAQRDDEA